MQGSARGGNLLLFRGLSGPDVDVMLGGVPIAERSQSLRIVIYGDGSTMPLEAEIQEVARNLGTRTQKMVEGIGVQFVGDETYLGVGMLDSICSFARQRERSASSGTS
jgi:hypothetical protein